jgi:BON domain
MRRLAMARRDDEFRRGIERPQFSAYDGIGDEHGEPREYHYGHGFDEPERGRWPRDREGVFSQPYDQWSNPGYVFYAGKGYHREFIDPFATSPDPEGGEGGVGWQLAREPRWRRGPHTGRGPKGYVRSDERIWEEVNDRLEQHGEIDATDVEVGVSNGEVTLEGIVSNRVSKRLAEDVAESVSGVRDVHNRLRVAPRGAGIDVDVQGPSSHSGTGFLTENRETSRRTRSR